MPRTSAASEPSKISWQDFESLHLVHFQDRNRTLAAQTPISFVVNTHCASQKLRSLRPGGVLNSVIEQGASAVAAADEYSVGTRLNSSVPFDLIEREISSEPCIRAVGYDGELSISQLGRSSADPILLRQTHLSYIQFQQGLGLIQSVLMIRKPVVIAVIDAGTDLQHPDLAAGIWRNSKEVSGNGFDDDRNGYVDDMHGYNFGSQIGDPSPQLNGIEGAHGTHVAGLAAARWKNGVGGMGVGGIAKIMAINVFGRSRTTKSSVVENAIRYAARNGADVINLSLSGGEYSRTMESALRYAVSRGAFVAAAAGNEGLKFESSPALGIFYSPAAYGKAISGMVSVSSIDTETGSISSFSNYNSAIIQIGAPGAVYSFGQANGLLSTFPRATYGTLAGTSMATPLVSGAAALVFGYLKACGMSATPSRVETILLNGSTINPKLKNYVGNGRELNILKLAQHLRALGCR